VIITGSRENRSDKRSTSSRSDSRRAAAAGAAGAKPTKQDATKRRSHRHGRWPSCTEALAEYFTAMPPSRIREADITTPQKQNKGGGGGLSSFL
jgi:hypothetical protein